MAENTEFCQGTAVRVYATVQDTHRHNIDPTSVYLNVYDPSNTVTCSGYMTRESEGIYYGIYQLPLDASLGSYNVQIIAASGIYTSVVRQFSFDVVTYLHT